MNLGEIVTRPFILTLFKRDDGERMLLGAGAYEFKDSQLHFAANEFANDVVEVQGGDGALLAGQVRRASTQEFEGFVGDGTTTPTKTEELRRDFFTFFRKNHFYTAIYIFSDGSAIQRQRGYIVDAPEIKELYQRFPEYHVALGFEDVNYYSYAEDADGNEAYSQSATIMSSYKIEGGLIWDSVGVVFDTLGAEWASGQGGDPNIVTNDSIADVFPTITIPGPAKNPILENSTTGLALTYRGTITASQTLVINTGDKTAKLNGTNVVGNVSGNWVFLAPGQNRLVYTTDDADFAKATLEWQEIVG